MANVYCSVNVRQEPNEESEIVGKLYKDCGGYIVEYSEGWTLIESGKVSGWVCNDYLLFGDEAKAAAEEVGSYPLIIGRSNVLRTRNMCSS